MSKSMLQAKFFFQLFERDSRVALFQALDSDPVVFLFVKIVQQRLPGVLIRRATSLFRELRQPGAKFVRNLNHGPHPKL